MTGLSEVGGFVRQLLTDSVENGLNP